MGEKYEDSHVENIDRFGKIVKLCEAYGTDYNPSNPELSIANMTLRKEEADQLNSELIEDDVTVMMVVNERQDLIKELLRRMRRVKNEVYSTSASKEFKRDVKALVDKFTGDKVRKPKNKEGEEKKEWVSNSHLGVASRMETFLSLREMLRIEPTYTPNEPILTMARLDEAADKLANLTMSIDEASANASTKRIARNRALYLEDDGLVDVSLKCKSYVRGVYGARSEEAKELSKIQLKRFMKVGKI
ncbi:MAG: hypothetical protein WCL06_01045 [Bacteroidota bacterium]